MKDKEDTSKTVLDASEIILDLMEANPSLSNKDWFQACTNVIYLLFWMEDKTPEVFEKSIRSTSEILIRIYKESFEETRNEGEKN